MAISKEYPLSNDSTIELPERLGCVTSSAIHAVLAKARNGDKASSATRNKYIQEKVIERTTGKRGKTYKSEAMEQGNFLEDAAALAYEFKTGKTLERCGFYRRKDMMAGSSPDRKVKGENGIVQIKCFEPTEHAKVLREKKIPPNYRRQMIDELANTDFDYNDFVSYNADFPPNAQLYVERIWRKDVQEEIDNLDEAKAEFLSTVSIEVDYILNFKQDYLKDLEGASNES